MKDFIHGCGKVRKNHKISLKFISNSIFYFNLGLSFLLPFLFAGYFFQAYNSYVLYKLSKDEDAPWQVYMLSILFFVLFIGNTFTTLMVVPQKLRDRIKEKYRLKSVSWAMKIREKIRVSSQLNFVI